MLFGSPLNSEGILEHRAQSVVSFLGLTLEATLCHCYDDHSGFGLLNSGGINRKGTPTVSMDS